MQGWTGPSGIQVLEQYITPEDITNIGITLHAHMLYITTSHNHTNTFMKKIISGKNVFGTSRTPVTTTTTKITSVLTFVCVFI